MSLGGRVLLLHLASDLSGIGKVQTSLPVGWFQQDKRLVVVLASPHDPRGLTRSSVNLTKRQNIKLGNSGQKTEDFTMHQDKESGARASHFGHQNGTALIAHLGGKNRKPGSNEFDFNGERVSIHSAHYRNGRSQSVGVTRLCLKTIRSVLGAFQDEDGSYRVLKLSANQFESSSRPTASRGPSSGRVLIVKRAVFEEHGKFLRIIVLA